MRTILYFGLAMRLEIKKRFSRDMDTQTRHVLLSAIAGPTFFELVEEASL